MAFGSSAISMHPATMLFLINGLGEIIAALMFALHPESLTFLTSPLDANSRFLFKAWAASITGFGIGTIMSAEDAALRPEQTRAITTGAIFYHGAVAGTYALHILAGVAGVDWAFGAAVHAVGAVAFTHHLVMRVNATRRVR